MTSVASKEADVAFFFVVLKVSRVYTQDMYMYIWNGASQELIHAIMYLEKEANI